MSFSSWVLWVGLVGAPQEAEESLLARMKEKDDKLLSAVRIGFSLEERLCLLQPASKRATWDGCLESIEGSWRILKADAGDGLEYRSKVGGGPGSWDEDGNLLSARMVKQEHVIHDGRHVEHRDHAQAHISPTGEVVRWSQLTPMFISGDASTPMHALPWHLASYLGSTGRGFSRLVSEVLAVEERGGLLEVVADGHWGVWIGSWQLTLQPENLLVRKALCTVDGELFAEFQTTGTMETELCAVAVTGSFTGHVFRLNEASRAAPPTCTVTVERVEPIEDVREAKERLRQGQQPPERSHDRWGLPGRGVERIKR